MLNNSTLWITGGKTQEEIYLADTELIFGQGTKNSTPGPDLPKSMSGHCMLNLGTFCSYFSKVFGLILSFKPTY